MNGTKEPANGADLKVNGDDMGLTLTAVSLRSTVDARERFAAGADTVSGVRPEILMSWYRCREQYGVDPGLDRAPAATEACQHSIEHDVMFAELGGLAAEAAREVRDLNGIVTVADPQGRVLAAWGESRLLQLAAESNLAPWAAWSERASGTNGMGTALESHYPVIVRGPEHWCAGFQTWTCAGIAVRDVVTDDPLAVINVSCKGTMLSEVVLPWLRSATASAQATLRKRAHASGVVLAAAFAGARVPAKTGLAAVDLGGNVVLANDEAATLLGTPADLPAYAPPHRWTPAIPAVPRLVRHIAACARQNPDWTGSTQVFVPFLDAPIGVSAHPVFAGSRVIGALLALGSEAGFGDGDGELSDPLGPAQRPEQPRPRAIPSRVVAMREGRWVLLDPREIRFAEADQNRVWLASDQGRLLAATRGLDHLTRELEDKGFLRVHRRYLVNLARVREIEQGFKGTLFVTTDPRGRETIPVARRQAAQLREALGM